MPSNGQSWLLNSGTKDGLVRNLSSERGRLLCVVVFAYSLPLPTPLPYSQWFHTNVYVTYFFESLIVKWLLTQLKG